MNRCNRSSRALGGDARPGNWRRGAAHALPIADETGAASCTYAGLSYSEGSVIKMEDGLTYKCSSDGSWVRARIAPLTGLPRAFQSGNFLQRAQ